MNKINLDHPCFNDDMCHKLSRIHLPVAMKCNIECNYCERQITNLLNIQPGYSSFLLKPNQVIKYLSENSHSNIIGIAGPGEALYNKETYETLKILKGNGNYKICLCTNGLLLEDKISEIIKYNLKYISITINAMNYEVGAQIYNKINYDNVDYYGLEAAKILINKQAKGLEITAKLNVHIKVNTIYIPNVNENEIIEVAKLCKDFNVTIMNIIPILPAGKFHNKKVDNYILNNLRNEASSFITQKKKCGRCRADAKGLVCEGEGNNG